MHKKQASHSTLLLIELIIAILFFSLASAICVQMFAHAHTLSTDTRNLNQAILLAERCGETFYSVNNMEAMETDTLYFNKDWTECESAEASFIMTVSPQEENNMRICDITISDNSGEEIYTLRVQKYLGGRVS